MGRQTDVLKELVIPEIWLNLVPENYTAKSSLWVTGPDATCNISSLNPRRLSFSSLFLCDYSCNQSHVHV